MDIDDGQGCQDEDQAFEGVQGPVGGLNAQLKNLLSIIHFLLYWADICTTPDNSNACLNCVLLTFNEFNEKKIT